MITRESAEHLCQGFSDLTRVYQWSREIVRAVQGVATRPSFLDSRDSQDVLFSVWKVKDFCVCV